MKKFLIFLLCGVMLLSLAACRGDKDEQEGSVPHEEGDVYVSYANEPTVDKFIQDFIKVSSIKPHDIRLGNVDGDYMFTVDLCDVTLHPADNGMSVIINAGRTDSQKEMALSIFKWCVKTLDSDANDSDVQTFINRMKTSDSSFGDARISMYCKLSAFIPAVDIETVETDCRIELWGYQYKADANATKSTIPYTSTTAAK